VGGQVATYDALIQQSLNKLREKEIEYLTGDSLRELSPKYAEILKNISQSPGLALVYSQFRTVEGLGILSMAMDTMGYCEFTVNKDDNGEWAISVDPQDYMKPKYMIFTSDKERTKVLLNVFNSDFEPLPPKMKTVLAEMDTSHKNEKNLHGSYIKVLMITQSGAEGISLQNVRQVHILEPYWNNIRIDQVIGRAVRAKSHLMLPPDERNVDVYVYVATFTEEQKEKSFTIRRQDNSLTSDEYILDIANRKSVIIEQILRIMRNGSIDCRLHEEKHEGIDCYDPEKGNAAKMAIDDKLLALNYISNSKREDRVKGSDGKRLLQDAKIIEYNNKKYIYDPKSGIMYDASSFDKGRLVKVGIVKNNKINLV
jgi:hypothetical protein